MRWIWCPRRIGGWMRREADSGVKKVVVVGSTGVRRHGIHERRREEEEKVEGNTENVY